VCNTGRPVSHCTPINAASQGATRSSARLQDRTGKQQSPLAASARHRTTSLTLHAHQRSKPASYQLACWIATLYTQSHSEQAGKQQSSWQRARDTGRSVSQCTPTNAASQQAIRLPARLQHRTLSLTVSRQADSNPLGSARATLDDQSHIARPPTQQASKLSACLLDCKTIHTVSQ